MNQTNSLDSHGLTPMYLMTHHAQWYNTIQGQIDFSQNLEANFVNLDRNFLSNSPTSTKQHMIVWTAVQIVPSLARPKMCLLSLLLESHMATKFWNWICPFIRFRAVQALLLGCWKHAACAVSSRPGHLLSWHSLVLFRHLLDESEDPRSKVG